MTSPVPGFAPATARTWSKSDLITTPRLRGDMGNLALLYAGGCRPILVSVHALTTLLPASAATAMALGPVIPLNTWQVPCSTADTYAVPLAGWYLVQADMTFQLVGSPNLYKYALGFSAVVNGAASADYDGGAVPTPGVTTYSVGAAGAELFQLNPGTSDVVGLYGYTNNTTSGSTVILAGLTVEWAGLPTSGLTDYAGDYGTVVSSPVAAAPWPSGPGTTITNSGGISAGATSLTVKDATGMITGGTLGLDVIAGQPYQAVAEPVTITSVAGTTIGIDACSYPHAQGAPVAVPVSAAFLNQQDRDIVNFLSYPPMLRVTATTTQSIASQSFPSGTQITNLSTASGGVDNFGGFASNTYTAPVAGTYFVYGQVYWGGTTGICAYSAGVQQNSGTIQWGTTFRSDTTGAATTFCCTVRRLLRLAAGDTIKLYGYQGSGSSMSTASLAPKLNSKLIIVWRST